MKTDHPRFANESVGGLILCIDCPFYCQELGCTGPFCPTQETYFQACEMTKGSES